MHGNFGTAFAGDAPTSFRSNDPTRAGVLRESRAAAFLEDEGLSGQQEEDRRRTSEEGDRAVELLVRWVRENTTRLNGLMDDSAALGLGEVELVTGHELFAWLHDQGLSQPHVCDYQSSARIARALQAQLEVALGVPIAVTCWGFYATWGS